MNKLLAKYVSIKVQQWYKEQSAFIKEKENTKLILIGHLGNQSTLTN